MSTGMYVYNVVPIVGEVWCQTFCPVSKTCQKIYRELAGKTTGCLFENIGLSGENITLLVTASIT
jgi:hypothetical protein